MIDRAGYLALLAQARRLSRGEDEARDLVQDTLLAAIERGRCEPAWLAGVLRRRAAMHVRGEVRRRRRERDAATGLAAGPADSALPGAGPDAPDASFLRALAPASRQLAVLALHGLAAEEIRWILGLEPAAFRQRMSRLRRALEGLDGTLRRQAAEAAGHPPRRSADLAFGRVRRALKAALRGPALGTHDPDGHLLVLRRPGHDRACRGNE
ncbi:transcriptional regulator [Pseudoxanthomonas broegbernensis]|uniref:Transcriptional regulator n=1 Tax=Pseudoxanthomonas broegbernensis TaxID=83619 RepID=A0A7V8GMP7_9GAMM|nr:sigma-70 family RNA polymerase sigma factor [Pseudoxanthomonas broegbernensis]KAF1686536.1 transcriptional regulator [Pseudoxanthomonas broegbernensis]MBB6064202.1 RNA polymerase sigma-70 factor (ECF subfamily) [Pseudoxanthomonas broegbernensis]